MPRQKGLGMNKKRKKAVTAREEAIEASQSAEGEHDDEQPPSPTPDAPDDDEAPAPLVMPPSPRKQKQNEAKAELTELLLDFQVAQELDAEAEQQMSLAERLYDAKMKRIETLQKPGQKRDRGSVFGEIERIYKAQLLLEQARVARATEEAHTHNAEANWPAQQCRVLRLEIARLHRVLRKHRVSLK
jgi:hypothetical protein